jgi:sugar phosphate permease
MFLNGADFVLIILISRVSFSSRRIILAVNPAVLTIIANWFPDEERARANALFLTSNAISQIILGTI